MNAKVFLEACDNADYDKIEEYLQNHKLFEAEDEREGHHSLPRLSFLKVLFKGIPTATVTFLLERGYLSVQEHAPQLLEALSELLSMSGTYNHCKKEIERKNDLIDFLISLFLEQNPEALRTYPNATCSFLGASLDGYADNTRQLGWYQRLVTVVSPDSKFLASVVLDLNEALVRDCLVRCVTPRSMLIMTLLYVHRHEKSRLKIEQVHNICQLLIEAGYDLTVKDEHGNTIQNYVEYYKWPDWIVPRTELGNLSLIKDPKKSLHLNRNSPYFSILKKYQYVKSENELKQAYEECLAMLATGIRPNLDEGPNAFDKLYRYVQHCRWDKTDVGYFLQYQDVNCDRSYIESRVIRIQRLWRSHYYKPGNPGFHLAQIRFTQQNYFTK